MNEVEEDDKDSNYTYYSIYVRANQITHVKAVLGDASPLWDTQISPAVG